MRNYTLSGSVKTKPIKANFGVSSTSRLAGRSRFSVDLRVRIVRLNAKRRQISILDFCFSISDLKIDNRNSAIGNQVNF